MIPYFMGQLASTAHFVHRECGLHGGKAPVYWTLWWCFWMVKTNSVLQWKAYICCNNFIFCCKITLPDLSACPSSLLLWTFNIWYLFVIPGFYLFHFVIVSFYEYCKNNVVCCKMYGCCIGCCIYFSTGDVLDEVKYVVLSHVVQKRSTVFKDLILLWELRITVSCSCNKLT